MKEKHGDPPPVESIVQSLLEKALTANVHFPSRNLQKKTELCAAVLEKHKLHHGYDLDGALNELKKGNGEFTAIPDKKTRAKKKALSSDQQQSADTTTTTTTIAAEESPPKKHKSHAHAKDVVNAENAHLVEMIEEVPERYSKAGQQEKAAAYALACQIIRESKGKISCGADAASQSKELGTHIAEHIDEYIKTGKLEVLEELRASSSTSAKT